MDSFMKAHVVKRESSRKEPKADATVKKQLKKMLTGYTLSDNKLIKSCDDAFDPNKMLDETVSVSDFSDLNFSNSNIDDDSMQRLEEKYGVDQVDSFVDDQEDTSNECDSNLLDSLIKSDSNTTEADDNVSDTELDSITTIEVGDNTCDSLINSDSNTTEETGDIPSDMLSIGSSASGSVITFDADGELANKILKKLKDGVVTKKGKKRKLDAEKVLDTQICKEESSCDSDIPDLISISSQSPSLKPNKEEINISTDDSSSEFVSIAPSEIPIQDFNDIVGEYKHSTASKRIDRQFIKSTNNTGIFTVENLNVQDVHITEPDVGNTDTDDVASLEMDETLPTDMDSSLCPVSESSKYDDSIQYEDCEAGSLSSDEETNEEDDLASSYTLFYGRTSCIIVLRNPSNFYLNGKAIVTLLHGNVEVLGYTLTSEPCEVYAPNYNYALCFKNVPHKDHCGDDLITKLNAEGLFDRDAQNVLEELKNFGSLITVRKLDNNKIDFVASNMKSTDFFNKTRKNEDECYIRPSTLLGCTLYLIKPHKTFQEISCAQEVMKLGLEDQSRGIICGGKGVGKSTFLRYCVNKLLARGPVLVVDLDPGQAEFTVAGNISATVVDKPLLGPNFTHLKTPKMMLNIGMINTMDNPRRYAEAVNALISRCNSDSTLKSMRWVVNTMGQCNSMGLKYITSIILQTQPTYLVQINAKNNKKNYEMLLTPDNVKNLYEGRSRDSLFRHVKYSPDLNYEFFVENQTDSSPKGSTSLAPRDERYLNFLAYFGELLDSKQKNGLLGITPYQVSLGQLHIGLNFNLRNEAVAKVINGKIIALCQQMALDNAGKVFTLKDKPLLCHGHGLIRGIDFEKEILYVTTPTPVDKLSLVDTLVYADWVPELRGQEVHLPDGVTIPYRTDTMYQRRQLMYTPRRRFNPLQLLKMSRNT